MEWELPFEADAQKDGCQGDGHDDNEKDEGRTVLDALGVFV